MKKTPILILIGCLLYSCSIDNDVLSLLIDQTIGTGVPVITITSPPKYYLTNQTLFTIRGTVEVKSPSVIKQGRIATNGILVSRDIAVQGTDWFIGNVVFTPNKTNTIRASAIANNNKTNMSEIIRVIIDTNPPTLIEISPTNGQLTGNTLTLAGKMTDELAEVKALYYRVDKQPYRKLALVGGVFVTNITVTGVGKHTNSLVMLDTAGNYSATNLVVFEYSSKVPSIIITAPANISYTNVLSVDVFGTSSIGAGFAVTNVLLSINGGSYSPVGGTTSWSLYAVSLNANATNIFMAMAFGDSGYSNVSASTILIADNQNPVVSMAHIPAVTNRTRMDIGVNVSDSLSGVKTKCFCTNGGPTNTITGNTFNTGDLPEGSYTFYVWAMDKAGNKSAVASATFYVETTAGRFDIGLYDVSRFGD